MLMRSRGFTLIEIMLVVVIIGCAAGIVVLSLPGMGSQGDGDIKSLSDRLGATLTQASEQSMLEGRTIGVWVDQQGYQFMVRQKKAEASSTLGSDADSASSEQPANSLAVANWDDQVWVPYEKEKFITKGAFPEGSEVELELGGLALDPEENRLGMEKQEWFTQSKPLEEREPQILLLPGGEITPFHLTLKQVTEGDEAIETYRQIRGDESGKIRVLTEDEVKAEDSK